MLDFFTYCKAVALNWHEDYVYLTAIPEVIERIAPLFLPVRFVTYVNAQLSRIARPHTRRRFYIFLVLVGIFYAGYSTWNDQYRKNVDLRQAPFAEGSAFFSTLPITDESVELWCFPYDAESCSIAVQYRNRLAEHFGIVNPSQFVVAMVPREADFKGINIATRSDRIQDRPKGARALAGQLRATHIPCQFKTDPSLSSKEFEVWIGSKP